MHVRIWDVSCIAVLCTILTLGLWPFHPLTNNVTWLPDHAGLRLGWPATLFGSNGVKTTSSQDDVDASLEVWVQPQRMWNGGTFLTLYRPENSRQFSLRQSLTDLELDVESHDRNRPGTARLYVPDVFRRTTPVFITLRSNPQGLLVYIDGVVARKAPGFHLSAADFAGRVIVGDSPRQTRTWQGQFLGLAFYEQALSTHQILRHYQNWMKEGRPELMVEDRSIALYLFNEHTENVVHSQIGSGSLFIPEKYTVLDKIRLEPFWEEFEMSQSYWSAVLKNIVGFIPVGFWFYAYWSVARPLKRPALATMVLGATVSFTIELLQAYLPTRESGMTDLITNTAGTAIGILALSHFRLSRFLPQSTRPSREQLTTLSQDKLP